LIGRYIFKTLEKTNNMKIKIEEKDIVKLSNNTELGEFVRKIYWEEKAEKERKKEKCQCENCSCEK